MNREYMQEIFDKWCRKLRLTPNWDVKLEFVEDPTWRKTGDFRVDCDDHKAILMLNAANPKQENASRTDASEAVSFGSGDGRFDHQSI